MSTRAVKLDVGAWTPGGAAAAADTTVELWPSGFTGVDGRLVVTDPIDPQPSGAVVQLRATDPGQGWFVRIKTPEDDHELCVLVPTGTGQIALSDLPRVNPRTLSAEGGPAWVIELASAVADATDRLKPGGSAGNIDRPTAQGVALVMALILGG